jgi:[ribosomal protein S18]-alanine N-acetyltransferase
MLENIQIRPYNESDKPAILELLRLNTPTYFAEEEESDLRNYLDHEIDLYFVVVIGDRVIGSGGINYLIDKPVARISWDLLHPELHRMGIGKSLLDHRLNVLKGQKNLERVEVRTSQLVYRFYQKNGFILTKIIKNYWAVGFDLYAMELMNG